MEHLLYMDTDQWVPFAGFRRGVRGGREEKLAYAEEARRFGLDHTASTSIRVFFRVWPHIIFSK